MLSDELAELLCRLRQQHWTLIRWGDESAPELLAAVRKWPTCSDVFILRSENSASAYRSPPWTVFGPPLVLFQVHSTPEKALRAVLNLPSPEDDMAPEDLEDALEGCRIPDGLPMPVVIRPM